MTTFTSRELPLSRELAAEARRKRAALDQLIEGIRLLLTDPA